MSQGSGDHPAPLNISLLNHENNHENKSLIKYGGVINVVIDDNDERSKRR